MNDFDISVCVTGVDWVVELQDDYNYNDVRLRKQKRPITLLAFFDNIKSEEDFISQQQSDTNHFGIRVLNDGEEVPQIQGFHVYQITLDIPLKDEIRAIGVTIVGPDSLMINEDVGLDDGECKFSVSSEVGQNLVMLPTAKA